MRFWVHRSWFACVGLEADEVFGDFGQDSAQIAGVLQQRPMTIILCDQTELAVEHVVAHAMIVGRPEA